MPRSETSLRLPPVSLAIAGIALVSMVIWSILQWPTMEPSIVTREAAGNHGTSTVPRIVTACAMPAALAALTVLFWFAPRIDGRLLKILGDPGTASVHGRRASPRVLGILLIGLSVLFATLHVTFISLHTPQQLPIASLVSSAAGLLLILLAAALPLVRPHAVTGTETETRLRRAQRRIYRRTAPLIMLGIGIVTIITAWLAPAWALPIAVGGVAILFAGIAAYAIIRARTN